MTAQEWKELEMNKHNKAFLAKNSHLLILLFILAVSVYLSDGSVASLIKEMFFIFVSLILIVIFTTMLFGTWLVKLVLLFFFLFSSFAVMTSPTIGGLFIDSVHVYNTELHEHLARTINHMAAIDGSD